MTAEPQLPTRTTSAPYMNTRGRGLFGPPLCQTATILLRATAAAAAAIPILNTDDNNI